jgi:hypothetical protein
MWWDGVRRVMKRSMSKFLMSVRVEKEMHINVTMRFAIILVREEVLKLWFVAMYYFKKTNS